MKLLILTLTFVIASTAQALPQYIGTFKFSGKLTVVNTMKREIVYTINQQGLDRLEKLRASGFTCEAVFSTTYKCTLNTDDALPESVERKIVKSLNQTQIIFGEPLSDWHLVSEAPYLTEFVMKQKTVINGDVYYSTHYYKTPDLHKVVLKNENGSSVWFNLYDEQLHLAITEQKTISKNQYESYLVEAGFQSQ